ncbi:hypothetical protein ES703_71890 [subsurface metagenome]
MAGLSSKAAEALKKAVSRDMLRNLTGFERTLETAIRNEEAFTATRELQAEGILSVEKYVDGREIWPKGRLFYNLTDDLDEAGLRSALSVVLARKEEVKAEERAFWEKQKEAHDRDLPEAVFVPTPGRFL